MDKLESDLESFVRLCHLHEKVDNLEQALAEKDREISSLQAAYRQELGRYKDDIHKLIIHQATDSAAYQQLMEKAVRFADMIRTERECTHGGYDAAYKASSNHRQAYDFLTSPEVQVWKEQQP